MSSFFVRGHFRPFSDIWMRLLLDVSLTDQQTSKKCWRCKENSESRRILTLEMSSLRFMVKWRSGKKQQEQAEKQQHVVATEINLFKSFTTNGVQNYDRYYSGKLDSDGRCCSSSIKKKSSTAWGIPCDATIKLAGLFLGVISNPICIKILIKFN